MSWNCPKTDKPCWQNCRGFECRDRDDDRVTCGGGPPGDPNGEKTALLLEFAQFLHTLPAEDGFDVGPARVKFDAHGATERVLWATQFEELCKVQDEIGEGAFLFRNRATGVRYGLRDIPPGPVRRNEALPACSFFCELAEQEYAA